MNAQLFFGSLLALASMSHRSPLFKELATGRGPLTKKQRRERKRKKLAKQSAKRNRRA